MTAIVNFKQMLIIHHLDDEWDLKWQRLQRPQYRACKYCIRGQYQDQEGQTDCLWCQQENMDHGEVLQENPIVKIVRQGTIQVQG